MSRALLAIVFALLTAGVVPAAAQAVTSPPPPSPGASQGSLTASPFTAIGKDLARFFSFDSARVVGVIGASALVAHRWDRQGIAEARLRLDNSGFKAGNVAGNFLVQTGAGVVTYVLGKATHSDRVTALGGDLFRAQMVSQVVVQGLKLSTHRLRPDQSDARAFPSGHAASAFATATVLQRYFGWKAGLPAYAFGAYVGAARMAADKHQLSDVVRGAGIGIAAGRAVTVGLGGPRRRPTSTRLVPLVTSGRFGWMGAMGA